MLVQAATFLRLCQQVLLSPGYCFAAETGYFSWQVLTFDTYTSQSLVSLLVPLAHWQALNLDT